MHDFIEYFFYMFNLKEVLNTKGPNLELFAVLYMYHKFIFTVENRKC